MKIIYLIIFLLITSFGVQASDPKITDLTQQPLPQLHEPPVDVVALPNGAKLYYKQDTALPIVHIQSFFTFGKINEPFTQRGITRFLMEGLQTGGTQSMTPDQVDELLDFVDANLEYVLEDDLSALALRCLQKDLPKVLPVYFEILQKPRFDETRLEIIRKQMLSEILQRNEQLVPIAVREFKQGLYGAQSSFAALFNEETVKGLTKDAVGKYYRQFMGPQNMLIAATSPLPFKEFEELITKEIQGWNVQVKKPEPLPALLKQWTPSITFINKPGATQSAIVLGHFGEKRLNPDRFSLILANNILGEDSISSKLGQEVRVRSGLAYTVRSVIGTNVDYGVFVMYTQTKSEATFLALEKIQKVFSDFVTQRRLLADELKDAQKREINKMIFQFEIPFVTVFTRLKNDYYGFPKDYVAVYQKEIEKVTLDGLFELMPKYFFPGQLQIMIVGDKTKIPGLETLSGLVERPLDSE